MTTNQVSDWCFLFIYPVKVTFNLHICIKSRNTKKAEDNISSLEKDIEENGANIKRLEVGISKLVII